MSRRDNWPYSFVLFGTSSSQVNLKASLLTLSSAAHLWCPLGLLTFTSLEVEPSHSPPTPSKGFDRSRVFCFMLTSCGIPALPALKSCSSKHCTRLRGPLPLKSSIILAACTEALDIVVGYSVPPGSSVSLFGPLGFEPLYIYSNLVEIFRKLYPLLLSHPK